MDVDLCCAPLTRSLDRQADPLSPVSRFLMAKGDTFYIPPGHDGWVNGDVPMVGYEVRGPSRVKDDRGGENFLWGDPD